MTPLPPASGTILVYTYDGKTARIYDNGVERGAEDFDLETAAGNRMNIAAENSSEGGPLFESEFGGDSSGFVPLGLHRHRPRPHWRADGEPSQNQFQRRQGAFRPQLSVSGPVSQPAASLQSTQKQVDRLLFAWRHREAGEWAFKCAQITISVA